MTIDEITKMYEANLNAKPNVKTNDMRKKITTMSDVELDQFILARLGFDGSYGEDGRTNHLRFDMSGMSKRFSWLKESREIIDLFIDCGIYDRVVFIHVDAYKGGMHMFYKWWEDNDYLYTDGETAVGVMDFTSMGTRDIIKRIIKFFCIENQNKSVRRLD
jgi:hypothetical protein